MPVTYRQAGVDIDAGDALVERIKPAADRTRTRFVLDGIGGFAGLCAVPPDVEDPILVSGTDGVGTKLKLAFATGRHDTIGQDLVAMCVNDVVTTGARTLFFLDYFACGRLDVDVAASVIGGIAKGCELAGCALLGGETAELPDMYPEGEYDLAGFAVGIVGRKSLLGRDRVRVGDAVLAVASSGLHSNGYSLARHVLEKQLGLPLAQPAEGLEKTLGDVLLEPTRIYARAVAQLSTALGAELHALCHVTGGGIPGNLPRVLPDGTLARLRPITSRPAIFDLIARGGPVEEDEMLRTFNVGVGLMAVVDARAVDRAVAALEDAGERAWIAGEIAASAADAPAVVEFR